MQSLLHSYEQLWRRMAGECWVVSESAVTASYCSTGVAPSHGSMCAELSVVLATCQLLIILLQWSRVKYFIISTLDRGSRDFCMESLVMGSLCSIPSTFSWGSFFLPLYLSLHFAEDSGP